MQAAAQPSTSSQAKMRYEAVSVESKSNHGLLYTIEDEEDEPELEDDNDQIEIVFSQPSKQREGAGDGQAEEEGDSAPCKVPKFPWYDFNVISFSAFMWNTLTFAWMKPLLALGNERTLEQSDLYVLPHIDRATTVYARFKKYWSAELKAHPQVDPSQDADTSNQPSISKAFFGAFGWPFVCAGILKLVHDSCLFLGPLLLNDLIKLLSDPYADMTIGYMYVLGLLGANFMMSLCLRQYFWWCYRTGMNLRSAVITSVYNKALVISAASLHTKSTGQITNLMSVDATRLQELTPYLHAIWYSFYQIVIAMYLLWQQMGPSCLAGCGVIIATIPLTGKITAYMKTLQKQMSTVRDERIKVSNEVLSGMKVIKVQAWENEYKKRIEEIRNRELHTFRNYVIAQALSGALYTFIPLCVGICTFTSYIATGHTLTVATALTSLALFEILRFPLFMLPNVLNNIVEARVSVDRVQTFLLEPEKRAVPVKPLQQPGVLMDRATLVWERTKCATATAPGGPSNGAAATSWIQRIRGAIIALRERLSSNSSNAGSASRDRARSNSTGAIVDKTHTVNPLWIRTTNLNGEGSFRHAQQSYTHAELAGLNSQQYGEAVMHAQLWETENRIEELELQLQKERLRNARLANGETSNETVSAKMNNEHDELDEGLAPGSSAPTAAADRLLALSRVCLQAGPGHLVAIVGQVGSGKSSILSAVLGDMKLCFGAVSKRGRVAYVGQRPFIQNSTLRDNITFGYPLIQSKYEDTLEMCALKPDLKVLPAGDFTEIGERGINLSGGQKARVALARAVYANADVLLLDDPLAAVDAHVGQHLFTKCIQPMQRGGKCVLLVTNALQYVKYCSRIIVIKNGRILESGTFDELMSLHANLSEMMAAFQDTKEEVNMHSHSSEAADGPALAIEDSDAVGAEESNSDEAFSLVKPEVAAAEPEGGNNDNTSSGSAPSPRVDGSSSPRQTRSASQSTDKDGSKSIELVTVGTKPSKAATGALITAEEREVGNVSITVYLNWARAAGGVGVGVCMLLFYFSGEGVAVISSWWLSFWSAHKDLHSPWFYLGIYVLINVCVCIFALVRDLFGRFIALKACRLLFSDMLVACLYAPMEFYDTTPLGRIINRFSKDVYTIDEQIPQTVRGYLGSMCKVIGVCAYITIITPLFVLCLVPVCAFYYVSQKYYIKTSRELTRLDGTSRSPIFALFSETLDGLSTIRAFQCENRFRNRNYKLLDANQQAYFLNYSANCWLAVRLELAGTAIVTLSALLAVIAKQYNGVNKDDVGATVDEGSDAYVARMLASSVVHNLLSSAHACMFGGPAGDAAASATTSFPFMSQNTTMLDTDSTASSASVSAQVFAGLAGLAISMALNTTQSLNWSVRMASDLESQMVSVERVQSYSNMKQEAAHYTSRDPPPYWPAEGAIEMRNVSMRYRDGLPLVLRGVTLSIKPREKIGVVGRTGAGKSSLLSVFLRLVELEGGTVMVDGVDVATIGLHALRSRIAVIPQDPVLFSGTVRSNLDPFRQYTDAQLWESLGRVTLTGTVNSLDMSVSENGSNFSVGQRQLLCIARALLSKARIIIMDEATAAVDVETDAAIQKSIREEFAYATCLTVAHRLNTIMDSDKVLVLESGQVAEFDTPANLLKPGAATTMFADLVAHWNEHEE